MQGEEVADRDVASRPAGEDAPHNSAAGPENHDVVADLVSRIRAAAAAGAPLAAGAKVTVRRVGGDLFRVERGRP